MGFNAHGAGNTNYTQVVSQYIHDEKYEKIPPMVIDRAKMMVLHGIGVSLCASELKQGQDVIAMAKELSGGSKGEATIWGDGAKVSLEAAGLVAGCLGDLLDWEDCSWTGHPTCGVIPAAVLGAEALHKSGKDLLSAVVVGYEVYQRLSMAAMSNLPGMNVWAALPPLMRLFDLDVKQINQCLGVGTACALQRGNVHEMTMSDILNYEYGYRVENAVTMVRNVLLGIENMEDAFDDPTAFLEHMKIGDHDLITKDLGSYYIMMDSLMVKHWPANVFCQTYLDVADKLRRNHDIDPDQIEEIILRPSVKKRTLYTDVGFDSATQAQFNIPYTVACSFYYPVPGADWYRPEVLHDPRVVSLLNRVRPDGFIPVMPNHAKTGSFGIMDMMRGGHPEKHIIVRMKDGREFEECAFQNAGHPFYMLTKEEFADRFRTETARVLSPEKIEKVIDIVNNLEQYDDISVLTECLY